MCSGAKADLGSETIYVGRAELFKELGHNIAIVPNIQRLRNEGNTVILVGTKKKIAGLIAIRDEIRPEAKEASDEQEREHDDPDDQHHWGEQQE